jgi:hypothetical protein
MSTYRYEKYGFEIDLSDEWNLYSAALPLLPTIMFTIANGWIPKTDVEFSTGPNEYLNIVVETIKPEPSPEFLESFFDRYAEQMGFTNCMFGRILVGHKEHVWARYQMPNNIWSKKYMIILNDMGYAISASCSGMEMIIRREKSWDEIVASLRLLKVDR